MQECLMKRVNVKISTRYISFENIIYQHNNSCVSTNFCQQICPVRGVPVEGESLSKESLCPGGSPSKGYLTRGSLSRGISDHGVSVQGISDQEDRDHLE